MSRPWKTGEPTDKTRTYRVRLANRAGRGRQGVQAKWDAYPDTWRGVDSGCLLTLTPANYEHRLDEPCLTVSTDAPENPWKASQPPRVKCRWRTPIASMPEFLATPEGPGWSIAYPGDPGASVGYHSAIPGGWQWAPLEESAEAGPEIPEGWRRITNDVALGYSRANGAELWQMRDDVTNRSGGVAGLWYAQRYKWRIEREAGGPWRHGVIAGLDAMPTHHDLCRMPGRPASACPQCKALRDRDDLMGDRAEAADVATRYYELLDQMPDADAGELAALKERLDELEAPYHDNPAFPAYVAFLKRKRLVAEAGGLLVPPNLKAVFERLGVTVVGADGKPRSSDAVFDDVVAAAKRTEAGPIDADQREMFEGLLSAATPSPAGWQKGEPEDKDGAYVVRFEGLCGVAYIHTDGVRWRLAFPDEQPPKSPSPATEAERLAASLREARETIEQLRGQLDRSQTARLDMSGRVTNWRARVSLMAFASLDQYDDDSPGDSALWGHLTDRFNAALKRAANQGCVDDLTRRLNEQHEAIARLQRERDALRADLVEWHSTATALLARDKSPPVEAEALRETLTRRVVGLGKDRDEWRRSAKAAHRKHRTAVEANRARTCVRCRGSRTVLVPIPGDLPTVMPCPLCCPKGTEYPDPSAEAGTTGPHREVVQAMAPEPREAPYLPASEADEALIDDFVSEQDLKELFDSLIPALPPPEWRPTNDGYALHLGDEVVATIERTTADRLLVEGHGAWEGRGPSLWGSPENARGEVVRWGSGFGVVVPPLPN